MKKYCDWEQIDNGVRCKVCKTEQSKKSLRVCGPKIKRSSSDVYEKQSKQLEEIIIETIKSKSMSFDELCKFLGKTCEAGQEKVIWMVRGLIAKGVLFLENGIIKENENGKRPTHNTGPESQSNRLSP